MYSKELWKHFGKSPSETILLIPEIEEEEEGCCFELNSYILIIDTRTGEIKHKYFESSKTNNWSSDAVALSDIIIDTIPYPISENDKAFGVQVNHIGMSKPNPYSSSSLSLFIKSGNTLKKVLKNYDVKDYGGEWDTNCYGEFINTEKTLSISNTKTNGYYDIFVKTITTEIKNYEDSNGVCKTKKVPSSVNTTLKFNGKAYKKART